MTAEPNAEVVTLDLDEIFAEIARKAKKEHVKVESDEKGFEAPPCKMKNRFSMTFKTPKFRKKAKEAKEAPTGYGGKRFACYNNCIFNIDVSPQLQNEKEECNVKSTL